MVKRSRRIALCVGLVALLVIPLTADQIGPPPQTARTLPITFTHDVDAAHAKSGDVVMAKTIQTVWVGGMRISSGSIVTGHVVEARPFPFDPKPSAQQQVSVLSIHFDRVTTSTGGRDLTVSIRALAQPAAVREAKTLQHTDEGDITGYFVQIGGDSYRGNSDKVLSKEGDVAGYLRKDGIYSQLLEGRSQTPGGQIECDSTSDEQPVSVFSANACGVYGVKDLYIAENGRSNGSGTFRLESFHRTVTVYKGSAALLESID